MQQELKDQIIALKLNDIQLSQMIGVSHIVLRDWINEAIPTPPEKEAELRTIVLSTHLENKNKHYVHNNLSTDLRFKDLEDSNSISDKDEIPFYKSKDVNKKITFANFKNVIKKLLFPDTIKNLLTDHDIAHHRDLGLFSKNSDIDHNAINNSHNLTSDIDHDALANFVADEHIDWTDATEDFKTTGDVGIGKTAAAPLDVLRGSSFTYPALSGATAGIFARDNSVLLELITGIDDVSILYFSDSDTRGRGYVAYTHGGVGFGGLADSLTFGTANTQRMVIDSSGDVGIGTATPATKLDVNGAITARGDLLFIGSGSGLVRGEISVVSNTNEITIVTQNVYEQITDFDTNGENNNTTPDHTNNHILIDIAGVYFITCSITLESIGGAGSTAEMEVQKNNGSSRVGALHVDRTLSGGGAEAGAISMSGHAPLAVNDTVEVWIKNENNTQNYIVEDITLSATLVGGV